MTVKNTAKVQYYPQGFYATEVGNLKEGTFFVTHRESITDDSVNNANAVWIRGEYDRTEKKYSCTNFNNINRERFLSPSKIVYFGFTF